MKRPERLFWFRLARMLHMSVRRTQREIDAREFAEWIAFEQIDPSGEERADLRIGILCALVAGIVRRRGGKIAKPVDFMPKFGEEFVEHKKLDPKKVWASMVFAHTKLGGTVH